MNNKTLNRGDIVRIKPSLITMLGYPPVMAEDLWVVSVDEIAVDGITKVQVLCEDDKYRTVDSIIHLKGM